MLSLVSRGRGAGVAYFEQSAWPFLDAVKQYLLHWCVSVFTITPTSGHQCTAAVNPTPCHLSHLFRKVSSSGRYALDILILLRSRRTILHL